MGLFHIFCASRYCVLFPTNAFASHGFPSPLFCTSAFEFFFFLFAGEVFVSWIWLDFPCISAPAFFFSSSESCLFQSRVIEAPRLLLPLVPMSPVFTLALLSAARCRVESFCPGDLGLPFLFLVCLPVWNHCCCTPVISGKTDQPQGLCGSVFGNHFCPVLRMTDKVVPFVFRSGCLPSSGPAADNCGSLSFCLAPGRDLVSGCRALYFLFLPLKG